MSDILAEICERKRQDLIPQRRNQSIESLYELAHALEPPRGFGLSLASKVAKTGMGLIAEIKRASPSGGLIRPDFDPPAVAQAYEAAGAACLSVLTDEPYFQGTIPHLKAARAACSLPVLRKDFMIDPYQVVEARAIGADCILIIMAALDDGQAREIEDTAMELGLDVLIEVHDRPELDRALKLRSNLLGVNNRNLKTLVTSLETTVELAAHMPPDRVLVCESGLKTHADLKRMAEHGARRFLVGESLLRQPDIGLATRQLLGTAP